MKNGSFLKIGSLASPSRKLTFLKITKTYSPISNVFQISEKYTLYLNVRKTGTIHFFYFEKNLHPILTPRTALIHLPIALVDCLACNIGNTRALLYGYIQVGRLNVM